MKKLFIFLLSCAVIFRVNAQNDTTDVSDLTWFSAFSDLGQVQKDNNAGADATNSPNATINIDGTDFTKGLGVFGNSKVVYAIESKYAVFETWYGIDAWAGMDNAHVSFEIRADNDTLLFESDTLTVDSPAFFISVPVFGFDTLKLITNKLDMTPQDWADWGSPKLIASGYLSDISWATAQNGWGPVEIDMSNGPIGAEDGDTLEIEGVKFEKGLGVHANAELKYALNGDFSRFTSFIGIDDWSSTGNTIFNVYLDDSLAYTKNKVFDQAADTVDVGVFGIDTLTLEVLNNKAVGNGGNHSDWASAALSKKDCNGDLFGSAFTDACGDCVGGNTGLSACPVDCNGVGDGTAALDNCGYCAGGDTGLTPDALCSGDTTIYLSDFPVYTVTQGNFKLDKAANGSSIDIENTSYAKGLGVFPASEVKFPLNGNYHWLNTDLGIDQVVVRSGSVIFRIFLDDSLVYSSSLITYLSPPIPVSISVANADTLKLVVEDGGNGTVGDQAVWAGISVSTSDCNGDVGGVAYEDACGTCVGGNTGLSPAVSCDPGVVYTGDTIYVDRKAQPLFNDGSSWTDAFLDLKIAIDSASAGDQIWVAQGTYKPTAVTTERSKSFGIKSGVAIFGGFDGTETELSQRDWSAHKTILSGDIDSNDVDNDGDGLLDTLNGGNSYNLLTARNRDLIESTLIDGLYLTGGMPNGSSGQQERGGAILLYINTGGTFVMQATFRNVWVEGNHVNAGVGSSPVSLHVQGSISPLSLHKMTPKFINCMFKNNSSGFAGGAVFGQVLGGGTLIPDFVNCQFINNRAKSGNGGAYIGITRTSPALQQPSFVNCVFYKNGVSGSAKKGGGIYLYAENGGRTVGLVSHCTFDANTATSTGTAIATVEGGQPLGTTDVIVNNSILWSSASFSKGSADASFSNSVVKSSGGSTSWNTNYGVDVGGNLDEDPKFIDSAEGIFSVQLSSPAFNLADPEKLPYDISDLDLDGITVEPLPHDITSNSRVLSGVPDAGAAETNENLFPEVTMSTDTSLINDSFEVQVVFSEKVNSFTKDSFTLEFAFADSLSTTDSVSYTAHFTPAPNPNGPVSNVDIDIAGGAAFNVDGYENKPASQLNLFYETDGPTPSFSTTEGDTVSTSFDLVILFDEDVDTLKLDDINITNATAIDFVRNTIRQFTLTLGLVNIGEIRVGIPLAVSFDVYGNGNRIPLDFTIISDAVANAAPTVANPVADQNLNAGFGSTTLDLSSVFTDADGDNLSLSATSSSPGVVTVNMSGTDLTITEAGAGTSIITVTANDGKGGTVSDDFEVSVLIPANNAPVVANPIDDKNLAEGFTSTTVDLTNVFTDADNDVLTLSVISSNSAVATVSISGNDLTITEVGTGTITITVTANDGNGGSIADDFGVSISVAGNNAPVVVNPIADQNLAEGFTSTIVDLSTVFTDADNDILSLSAHSGNSSVATVSISDSDLTITEVGTGTTTITVTADDGNGGSIADEFVVSVSVVGNNAPVVVSALADQNLDEGFTSTIVDLSNVFTDADNDILSLSAHSGNSSVATVSISDSDLTITEVGTGTTTITVTADDGNGGSIADDFGVSISVAGNNSPVVTNPIADQNLTEGFTSTIIDVSNVFSDSDNDALSLTATSSDATIATVSISGSDLTITEVGLGTTTITVTADDGKGGSVSDEFSVAISEAINNAPVVSTPLNDQNLSSGFTSSIVSLASVFNDADDDQLTLTSSSSDESVVIVALNGTDLTLTEVGVGSSTITIMADDGNGGTVSDQFEVTITEEQALGFEDEEIDIHVYPNPASDYILFEASGILNATIHDQHGKIQKTVMNANRINISNLMSGIYVIRFSTTKGNTVWSRFIKQ